MIPTSQKVADVCKAWREESILATIEVWHEVEISEADIKKKIMAKYTLDEVSENPTKETNT